MGARLRAPLSTGPLKSAVSIDATRLNNKLESWRGLYRSDARVASVGMLPDAFLRCGADARGGVRSRPSISSWT